MRFVDQAIDPERSMRSILTDDGTKVTSSVPREWHVFAAIADAGSASLDNFRPAMITDLFIEIGASATAGPRPPPPTITRAYSKESVSRES